MVFDAYISGLHAHVRHHCSQILHGVTGGENRLIECVLTSLTIAANRFQSSSPDAIGQSGELYGL